MPVNLLTEPTATGLIMRAGRYGRGRTWQSSMWRGVVVAAIVGLQCAGFSSQALASDTCVNAGIRAEGNSSGLPDCRAYEMVNPPYKEGFPIDPAGFRFTDDGVVSYRTTGSLVDNPQGFGTNLYHAARSSVDWITGSVSAPGTIYDSYRTSVQVESQDLQWSLWLLRRRGVAGDEPGFYVRSTDGTFARIGDAQDSIGQLFVAGVSEDFRHVILQHGPQGGRLSDLYEYVNTDNAGPPRPVSVNNNGDWTNVQSAPSETCLETVSDDARVIIYTAGCGGGTTEVWARVGGSASVAVSGSECTRDSGDPGGLCNGASAAAYEGGADDGSRVFFTTRQQLVNDDTDTGNDLYSCDIPDGAPAPVGAANSCASLTEVSGTANNARVEDVVAVSEDGSRVYFVAQGVLSDNLGVGDVGPATEDPHNLYVWDRDDAHPAGQTRFVARLDANGVARAELTPDGRYLLLAATTQLVTAGPGADTDTAVDAYRYDAITKAIVRVSTSVSGNGGSGSRPDGTGFDVSTSDRRGAMTADGSMAVFESAEGLAPNDTNGVTDVYAWRDGHVSLISAGGGNLLGVTPSGRDIFFTTDAPVLAADRDVITDIYDARVDGGFALTPTASPCSGDGCQGGRSQPPNLVGPSTPTVVSDRVDVAPSTFSVRSVTAAQRKVLAAKGTISLTVTANAPGTVSVSATAVIGGRSVTVGSARQILDAPGRAAIPLSLSKKARTRLSGRGRLTVKVSVSHSKVALDRSLTLRLVRAKAAKRSALQGPVIGERKGR